MHSLWNQVVMMINLQDFGLTLPKVGKKSKIRNLQVLHVAEKDELEHRLEDYVRIKYLKYVENLLRENYTLWLKSDTGQISGLEVTEDEIRKTAESIEVQALKDCMVVSLFGI